MDIAESDSARGPLVRVSQIVFLSLVGSLGFIQISLTDQNVVTTDILFLLAGSLWLFTLILGKRRVYWHKFYWLLLFYLAALFVSCLFSSNRQASLGRFRLRCIWLDCAF